MKCGGQSVAFVSGFDDEDGLAALDRKEVAATIYWFSYLSEHYSYPPKLVWVRVLLRSIKLPFF